MGRSPLSAAYPIAAGDYALVRHAFKGKARRLGGPVSLALFVLELVTGVLIVAVIALGMAQYVSMIHTFNAPAAGAVVTILATIIAALNIRTNAVVTGTFLTIELLALLSLTILGLAVILPGGRRRAAAPPPAPARARDDLHHPQHRAHP